MAELYAWYGWAEPMLTNVFRDAPSVPAMTQPVEDFQRRFQALHQALISRRRLGGRARARVSGAIGHGLAFSTWQSLVREQELQPEEAVELMSTLVAAALLDPLRPLVLTPGRTRSSMSACVAQIVSCGQALRRSRDLVAVRPTRGMSGRRPRGCRFETVRSIKRIVAAADDQGDQGGLPGGSGFSTRTPSTQK